MVQALSNLFREVFGISPSSVTPLPPSGSSRMYFRIIGKGHRAIGAFNTDFRENQAFVYLSRFFRGNGIRVPLIYAEDLGRNVYLQEDLGDATLLDVIGNHQHDFSDQSPLPSLYRQSLDQLVSMQMSGRQELDFSICYPRAAFDKQSIMWDLNYFKYNFLKFMSVVFDEQKLEDDFNSLADFLVHFEQDFFLFRDFQSRNIMIHNGEPWFIDYQGGRRGALYYDVASLLFEAKTALPTHFRAEMLDYYFHLVQQHLGIGWNDFEKGFYGFLLIRMLQAMGAYGYRGLFEHKPLFVQSIPGALSNLEWYRHHIELPLHLPELNRCFDQLLNQQYRSALPILSLGKLQVTVVSFSYKKGIPVDYSGNGGGFVFDCRAVNNPGRFDEFKNLTGKDQPVSDFLDNQSSMQTFIQSCAKLIDQTVSEYTIRGFSHLMVCFGCTGGQHRSVYAAERLAQLLRGKQNVDVVVEHREQRQLNNGKDSV